MLEIENLSLVVEGNTVLKNVCLNIPEGEVHILLGPNGSGKSSLLAAVAGYPQYSVLKGRITLMGKELSALGMTERARLGIGTAEQHPPVINGVRFRSLLDYILSQNPDRIPEVAELIKTAGMESFLDRNIHDGLSGGEIKKSELLLLMARQPVFSMLDEPDSGVDMDSLELIASMVNALLSPRTGYPARRRTGLIVTHSKIFAESVHADKAHVVLNGEIVCSGNPGIIMKKITEEGFDSCAACTAGSGGRFDEQV